jgi:hypothetical protein
MFLLASRVSEKRSRTQAGVAELNAKWYERSQTSGGPDLDRHLPKTEEGRPHFQFGPHPGFAKAAESQSHNAAERIREFASRHTCSRCNRRAERKASQTLPFFIILSSRSFITLISRIPRNDQHIPRRLHNTLHARPSFSPKTSKIRPQNCPMPSKDRSNAG